MAITLHIPVDAVICDMDGLLIDSEGLSTEAWRVTLARYGVNLQAQDFDDMFGLRIDEDAELIIQRYHVAATVPELVRGKSECMLALVRDHLQPMPGAREFVAWLAQQGVSHALATSGLGDYAATCLQAVGFADAFAIRVTGEQVPHGKPAPDIFLEASRRLNVPPERCLVLEDAPNGVAAANAAGMKVIAVPNAHTAALAFPPITARATSLHEVLGMLRAGS